MVYKKDQMIIRMEFAWYELRILFLRFLTRGNHIELKFLEVSSGLFSAVRLSIGNSWLRLQSNLRLKMRIC